MKFQYVLALILALLCTFVASVSIPYSDLDDFQVAKLFAADIDIKPIDIKNEQGAIKSPAPNTTWYVGDNVSVVCTLKS
jgi:spore coat protein CotH